MVDTSRLCRGKVKEEMNETPRMYIQFGRNNMLSSIPISLISLPPPSIPGIKNLT
jgi:hypothetical protein